MRHTQGNRDGLIIEGHNSNLAHRYDIRIEQRPVDTDLRKPGAPTRLITRFKLTILRHHVNVK